MSEHPLTSEERLDRLRFYGKSRDLLIETGTGDGYTSEHMAAEFRRVITIEIAMDNYLNAVTRLSKFPNVTYLFGDSDILLPLLLDGLGCPANAVYWLDAHDNGHTETKTPNPILNELTHVLARRPVNSVVLVDDLMLFGVDPDYPTLIDVEKTVENLGYKVHYDVGIMRIET